jgi:hypothetical protein
MKIISVNGGYSMTKVKKAKLEKQCETCKYRSAQYADRGCHKFKGGIKNIINTSWVDENKKCKLYESE